MQYITKKHSIRKKLLFTTLVILLVAGGGFAWWHKSHSTVKVIQTNNHGQAVANPNVPGKEDNGQDTGTGAGASKDSASNEPAPSPTSSVQPAKPTGQFISNHHPSLSGKNGIPNTETSTCSTTPGVDCQIRFTSGSVTKSLSAQKTDGNGNVIWNWKLQDIGLTVGTWKVTAVAINGGKAASAQDALQLVVSQ